MDKFTVLEFKKTLGFECEGFDDIIVPTTAIHYILDGFGFLNGVKLGKGQFFCTKKGCRVSYYPDPENPWTYCYARLDCKDFSSLNEKCGMTEKKPYGNFSSFDELELLYKLYLLHATKATENKDFLESLGYLLLSLHKKRTNKDATEASTVMYRQIKQYIDINYYKNISIEEIARDSYLSRSYLCKIFQANVGLPPKQYLKKVRMEKAVELLTETNYPIALIAKSVGYEDQLAFSKTFKLTFGMSPSEHRTADNKKVDTLT